MKRPKLHPWRKARPKELRSTWVPCQACKRIIPLRRALMMGSSSGLFECELCVFGRIGDFSYHQAAFARTLKRGKLTKSQVDFILAREGPLAEELAKMV